MRTFAYTIWIAVVGASAGCAHRATQESPGLQKMEALAAIRSDVVWCSSDVDCRVTQLCVQQRCATITPLTAECSEAHLHFDLDSADVAPGDEGLLDRGARCLKANHAVRLTIEANADEDATELGAARTGSVVRTLEALGVTLSQLRSVTIGQEQPIWVVSRLKND